MLAVAAIAVVASASLSAQSFNTTSTLPANIPDGSAGPRNYTGAPVNLDFAVTGLTNTVVDVQVSFTITHTWAADVEATLIAPNAASHQLFETLRATSPTSFGTANDFNNSALVFSDGAAANIWDAAATNPVPSGTYRTVQSGATTTSAVVTSINAVFAGMPSSTANGTWTLRIRDGAGGDTGSVSAASITFVTGVVNATPALSVVRDSTTTPVAITNGSTIGVAQGSTLAALDLEFSVTDADTGDTLTLTAVVGAGITGFVQAEWDAGPSTPPTQPLVATPSTGTFDTFGLIAVQLTASDGTANTVLSFTIRVALGGTYTAANGNPGSAFDFGDIGDFFDDLESFGVAGPVTLEVYDDGGNFTSSASYGLGWNAAGSNFAPVAGSSTANSISVVAAAGESPVVSGSGALVVGDSATMLVINVANVTFRGLELTGGVNYGLFLLNDNVAVQGATVTHCRIHGITGNCGILVGGNGTGDDYTDILIENNLIYNYFTAGTASGILGSISSGLLFLNNLGTNVVARHNTIANNNAAAASSCVFTADQVAEVSFNLLHASGAGQFVLNTGAGMEWAAGNYNIFFATGTAAFHANTATYADLVAWQTANATLDQQSNDGDPTLTSTTAGSEDLTLTASSTNAIDMAIGSSTSDDFFGNARPSGAESDIGAHEFLQNAPPVLALATGSTFAAGSDFDLAVNPGASLGTANLEATDADADPIDITVTFATGPMGATPPTGITAPAGGTGLTGTVALNWSGTASGADTPGTYEWDVTLDDGINTPVGYTVNITINDQPPTHLPATAIGGDGLLAGTPYTTTFLVGNTAANIRNIAGVTDPNTGQTITVTNVNQTSGPNTGAGFDFAITGSNLTAAPAGTLDANDVGVQVFEVTISDGTNNVIVHIALTVLGSSGAITFNNANPLPNGVVGTAYSVTITVSGAAGATTFSVLTGTLPTGLSLNGATGEISGNPSVAATSNFTLLVVDSVSDSATQAYAITITTTGGGGGGGGGSGGGDDSSCSTGGNSNMLWLAVAGVLAGLLVVRSRKSRA